MKFHENSISISRVATWEQMDRQGVTNRRIFAPFHCKRFNPLCFRDSVAKIRFSRSSRLHFAIL
jgi:hypothetical protein